jgi:CBS domain-containing protein
MTTSMSSSIQVGTQDVVGRMAEIVSPKSQLSNRYRGVRRFNPLTHRIVTNQYLQATVEDLDPPSALSCHPTDPIQHALLSAFERDYTHLTVISPDTRALLGYLSIPNLQSLLKVGTVKEHDEVSKAMVKFRRKGRVYKVITMDTPLEELELFFSGEGEGGDRGKQDFAVVTDERRRFVLGVATKTDLEEFARRRPA